MKISMSELLEAPRSDVFKLFTDIENASDRISGIRKLEVLSEVRSGVGLRWRETRVMFGKEATEEMEITGFDEPESYVVEAESLRPRGWALFSAIRCLRSRLGVHESPSLWRLSRKAHPPF